MCNKGAGDKTWLVVVFFFLELGMSGDIEAESLFSDGGNV